jgi:hypothetical protein
VLLEHRPHARSPGIWLPTWSLGEALFIGLIFASCTYYTVNDRRFDNKQDALAAYQQQSQAILAEISPTETPIGGSIKIVLPTRQQVEESGIEKTGSATPEQIDYVATAFLLGLDAMADAVVKRKLFDRVDIEHAPSSEQPSAGSDDFVLWFYQPAPLCSSVVSPRT